MSDTAGLPTTTMPSCMYSQKTKKIIQILKTVAEARVGSDFSLDNCNVELRLILHKVFNWPSHFYHFRRRNVSFLSSSVWVLLGQYFVIYGTSLF